MNTLMEASDRVARRWMLVVGVVYLFLGVRLLPFINGPMIEGAGIDGSPGPAPTLAATAT